MKSSVMPMDRAFRGVVNPPPTVLIVSKKYQSVYFTYCNYSYYN